MPTQQELNDILRRNLLIEQAVGNTQAMRGRAGMPIEGPIDPASMRAMVAQSQLRRRMGTDPQAARFRRMLANPAQAASDPNADTPEDVARKAAMARMALIPGGRMIPADSITPGQMSDYRGMERARFRPGSEFMTQRSERMKRGDEAASASRAKSANLAFRRGVLRPGAEAVYAQQGVIPDRAAQAMAYRIALAQAMQQRHGGGNPVQALIADRLRNNPAALDNIIGKMTGDGATPEVPAEPGSLPVSPPSTKIVGGGTITTTPPNPNIPVAPPSQPTGLIRIGSDGTKYYRDDSGKVTVVKPGGLLPGDVQPAPFW